MHFCGNPWHDIPANLPFLFPALAPLFFWWRARRAARAKSTHTHNGNCKH